MREALALNPNHPNFINNLGTCFYKLHKYSVAKKYYEKGLEIDNNHLHILNNLGNLKRETNKIKEDIPINDFRSECRAFAKKWIDIQKKQFMRLGLLGNWDNPYTTMEFSSEASIVEEFHKFLMNGDL